MVIGVVMLEGSNLGRQPAARTELVTAPVAAS
jgi:hypothetical protein